MGKGKLVGPINLQKFDNKLSAIEQKKDLVFFFICYIIHRNIIGKI